MHFDLLLIGDSYVRYSAYLPKQYLIAAVVALVSANTGIVCDTVAQIYLHIAAVYDTSRLLTKTNLTLHRFAPQT